MNNGVTNVLLVGVGGQGIILASEVISEVALRQGLDSKKSEVHGMSQRGGVVSSHLRFGPKVYSPLVEEGTADVLCSFEILESLRWLNYLAPDGLLLVNDQKIIPPIAASGVTHYLDNPEAELRQRIPGAVVVPALAVSQELGNLRLVNTVMMGRMSRHLPFETEAWRTVIGDFVPPKARTLNLAAFERGRQLP